LEKDHSQTTPITKLQPNQEDKINPIGPGADIPLNVQIGPQPPRSGVRSLLSPTLNPLASPRRHETRELFDTILPPAPTESVWSQFKQNQKRNQGLPLGLPLFYFGSFILAFSCYREMNLPPKYPGRFPKLDETKTRIDGTAVTLTE